MNPPKADCLLGIAIMASQLTRWKKVMTAQSYRGYLRERSSTDCKLRRSKPSSDLSASLAYVGGVQRWVVSFSFRRQKVARWFFENIDYMVRVHSNNQQNQQESKSSPQLAASRLWIDDCGVRDEKENHTYIACIGDLVCFTHGNKSRISRKDKRRNRLHKQLVGHRLGIYPRVAKRGIIVLPICIVMGTNIAPLNWVQPNKKS